MKIGYLRQDDSSHWYLIPEDMVTIYSEMVNLFECKLEIESDEWYNAIDEFENLFAQYRLGGGPENCKVIIE